MAAQKKTCQNCKKTLDILFFTDDKDKVLCKCNICRVKLIKTTNKCKVCGVKAIYNFEGEKEGISCSKHKDINMIDVKNKKCEYKSCKKKSSFNFEGEKIRRFCYDHKEENMIDIKHKKCEFKDCKKQPSFNFEGQIKFRFCKEHKEENMIDIKHKNCEFKGCKTRPNFNFEREIKARFCNEHKEENMININDKKCEFKGCEKIPNFNLDGQVKAYFCKDHKEENMIDIKHKNCEFNGCKTRPNFNFEGEVKARFCSKHKEINMINIKDKKCEFKGCKTLSTFGLPGTTKTHCAKHKFPGMLKHPNKRCTSDEECKEAATHGIKEPLFCEEHALLDHYNLCERKCTNSKCLYPDRIDILNKEGLCVTFCSLIKQDQMIKKYIKKKEVFIGNLLKEEIKQDLSHKDEVIDSSCTKVRPDFVYDCGTHIVIIEVDEHQHKSYSNCGTTKEERQLMENKRMFMIYQSFGGPNVIFIRYNPDSFRVKDKVVTVNDQKRHECLLLWVKHFIKNKSKFPIEVKYLFYDEYDERDQSRINIKEKDLY